MPGLAMPALLSMLLCTGAGITPAAHAENWVEIRSSANGGIRQFVDADSIEHSLGHVELRQLIDYQEPHQRRVNGKPIASQFLHAEFECDARAMRRLESRAHAGPMGTGEVLQQGTDTVWQIDAFDEFTLPLWKIACETPRGAPVQPARGPAL